MERTRKLPASRPHLDREPPYNHKLRPHELQESSPAQTSHRRPHRAASRSSHSAEYPRRQSHRGRSS
eukprot:8159049-Alexandrium_andersonii.AAC.1